MRLVVLDLHARIGVEHAIVRNVIDPAGPSPRAEGEGAGNEVGLVHAEAAEVGSDDFLHPLILGGDAQLLVHQQVAPRFRRQCRRVQRLAVNAEAAHVPAHAVVVPVVVGRVPAPVLPDDAAHAGVGMIAHHLEPFDCEGESAALLCHAITPA